MDGSKGGFHLRGTYKVCCTDGSYTHVKDDNAYRWSDAYLTIDYDGTVSEWNSIFAAEHPDYNQDYSQVIVVCSDGEFEYTP